MSGEMAHRGLVAVTTLCMVLGCCGAWISSGFSEVGAYDGADGCASVLGTGSAPDFVILPRDPQPATYGIQVNITAMVQDADNNTINVTWDWGDGNITLTQTLPALVSKIIKANHTYRPPIEQGRGDYIQNMTLMIYLDDGNGNNVSDPTTVQVLMPPNGLPTRPGLYLNGTSSTKLDPAELVYVTANSSDPEGESLTWTYVFTNGTGVIYRVVVLNTPLTAPNEDVWVNISHSFGTEGLHQIDIYVSDALVPYQIFPHNRTNTLFTDVLNNSMPLTSTISVAPNTPIIELPEKDYVLVTYTVGVFDYDGDVITGTWDFCDGSPSEVNESVGGMSVYYFSQVRNYTDAGWKNVSVVITDGRPGHEVFRNVTVFVGSLNLPPHIVSFDVLDLHASFVWVGEVVEFELIIGDQEMDPVEVVIDWGDGSPVLWFNMTDYVDGNATVYFSHTYLSRGNFTITINYTDNQIGVLEHSKTYLCAIEARELGEIPEFGSVASVAATLMLLLVFVASVRGRRRG